MNQTQQRFLLNRLEEARRFKPSSFEYPKGLPTPPEVISAQREIKRLKKVVERWNDRKDRIRNKRNASVSKAHQIARTAILFKDSKTALKAVEQFENLKF